MTGWQQASIIGNVGRDAELRYTQSGDAVCSFSVAVTQKWNDRQTNEKREKTTWFKCTAWRGLGEMCNQYVRKGMAVHIVGTVESSAWLDKEGQARSSLDLTINDIQFLNRADGNGNGGDSEYQPHPDDNQIPF